MNLTNRTKLSLTQFLDIFESAPLNFDIFEWAFTFLLYDEMSIIKKKFFIYF